MTTRGGTALFSGGGSRATTASKALVEFRAGKMTMAGTTVTPDRRKGQVLVEQGEDQLMHFKWKDRTSGTIEDDLIIFPDDVEFKKVAQCTTGRVFLLKFKSTTRKLFFWMQEPKEDKDEEFCKKVNDFLNNPPAPGSSSSRGGSMSGGSGGIPGLDLSNLGDSELQSLLNNMSQSQLMQLFGGGGLPTLSGSSPSGGGGTSTRQRSTARAAASAAAAATASPSLAGAAASTTPASSASTTTTTASSAAKPSVASEGSNAASIRLSDLQNVLSGMPGGASGSSSGGPAVDLSSGLTTEVLQPLLENPEFVRKMKELLPEEEQNQDDATGEVRGTLHSPQFRQALGLFSSGLQTGQLAPLIREFDLGEAAIKAANSGDMDAFVKALENKKKDGETPPATTEAGDKKEEEDDGMALD
jgi:26S proteasome regulatory subunit N13